MAIIKLNTENYIETHMLDKKRRPLVIIAPGGGYQRTSNREAKPIAKLFNDAGYHSAVVYYRETLLMHPDTTNELALFVKELLSESRDFPIDHDNIILCGFSSGGHYMGSLGVDYQNIDSNLKLKAMILCYPVISGKEHIAHEDSIKRLFGHIDSQTRSEFSLENKVSSHTPPTFLFHTVLDTTVVYQNSQLFFDALIRNKVSAEMHLYDKGPHGLSLATSEVPLDSYLDSANAFEIQFRHQSTWANLAISWLDELLK